MAIFAKLLPQFNELRSPLTTFRLYSEMLAEGMIRDEEGCLSFPDIIEVVERPEKVTIEAFDEKGRKQVLDGRDLLARAFCHEVDHLESRLFIDSLSSLKRGFVLRKVLKRQRQGAW